MAGHRIRLAIPLSSSRVMNITPLALPGLLPHQHQPGHIHPLPVTQTAASGIAGQSRRALGQFGRAGTPPGAAAATTPSPGNPPPRCARRASASGCTAGSRVSAAANSGNGASPSPRNAHSAPRRSMPHARRTRPPPPDAPAHASFTFRPAPRLRHRRIAAAPMGSTIAVRIQLRARPLAMRIPSRTAPIPPACNPIGWR